ncbi:bacteriohopanetetrol glucosamine biosynthesis glycosyltransferase HpnI [Commensalibacter oyaizuii]|uniref:Bacteriohopanetetrol glucosamine biosynthesis glycosyltransferase HpnI n=1 Tax=Commensalibacter oyaizuii TaxID=3043873 RepID=A0ABT6Q1H3_9PROT|nr:bacteriohopanetetrol glucosamine biosynthesis glycosyltransferase HpnI [Commensalibacter sp. TBRC 16381]MDI2090966.1 bacteriohopanetetrol glucosamine biosynthesis glycosyltransferase HpnI [Commensalibacter sp. TBRC 16381]
MSLLFPKFTKLNKFFFTCAALGCVQAGIGSLLVHFFNRKPTSLPRHPSDTLPKVTLFKPLSGSEPLLFEALKSFCEQDYPELQIIFGLQDSEDPAKKIAEKLQKQYAHLDIEIVINGTIHGINRKVSNLINMQPLAKNEIFIISDSDIHAPHPQYLQEMVAELCKKNVGLVTSLYSGLPSASTKIQLLASAHINYNFMPGVLLSRHLDRQDCLGAAIAIKRSLLNDIGGFTALLPHIADDAMIGRLVRSRNLDIALSPSIVKTTITENNLFAVYEHELRWNRTTLALEPVGYSLSFLQLPLFWATLAILFNPFKWGSWVCFVLCWFVKALCCSIINKKLNLDSKSVLSLLPYRDWLSALIMMKSFFGNDVKWRGQKMTIKKHPEFQSTTYNDK